MGLGSFASVTTLPGVAPLQAGGTSARCKQNLSQWLDRMALKFCGQSLVFDQNGLREEGYFHSFKLNEFFNFVSAIQATIGTWGNDCAARNMNCGKCYYLGGSGRGSMSLTHQKLGPFCR